MTTRILPQLDVFRGEGLYVACVVDDAGSGRTRTDIDADVVVLVRVVSMPALLNEAMVFGSGKTVVGLTLLPVFDKRFRLAIFGRTAEVNPSLHTSS
jgi:hypothetical protein